MLQGLLTCSECRYAYYGKTLRQRGAGGVLKDFIYYRCSGTDGYRFGGERICDNWQIQGKFIESAVWAEVCELLRNPQRLERQRQQKLEAVPTPENPEILTAQLKKLQRGMERLIDSYSEGVIEKEQFASRMSRTKERIAELEARIRTSADSGDAWQEFRLLVEHYRKLATHLGRDIEDADWSRRREIIRRVVERIEIGRESVAIIFRIPQEAASLTRDPIVVALSRR